MSNLPVAVRFALRELRGGIKGFRIFFACLALGVAAISGASSLNDSVNAGIKSGARPLLGGDLQAELSSRPAAEDELAALTQAGDITAQVQMRSMARTEDAAGELLTQSLIELKAIDDSYPLYGEIVFDPPMSVDEALGLRDGRYGAAIETALVERLNVSPGDLIKVGEATLELRAVITREPDRAFTFRTMGPRLMISEQALAETELVRLGSLISYIYNVRLTGEETADELRARLNDDFPQTAWRLRGVNQAGRGLDDFMEETTMFLNLVGLTALLTGGIGVANAVRAYLSGRITTIATLKCLGAPADLIFTMYMFQLGLLSALGIALGVAAGASVPFVAGQAVGSLLPVSPEMAFYPASLAKAAVFGVLTTAVFALWPLALARDIPPVALFRHLLALEGAKPRPRYLVMLAVLAVALAVFTIATSDEADFAAAFVAGAVVAMILFRFAAIGVMKLAKRLSSGRHSPIAGYPTLRLAMANLYRPGSPTTSVVLSLGLGLSVLVAVALLESNLNARIQNGLPTEMPSVFFIDIQPQQEEDFRQMVESMPGVNKLTMAAMIRARVTKLKGIPADEYTGGTGDSRWIIRGDRGISYAAAEPENSNIARGAWWAADHDGENLVSITEEMARDFGLELGDTITVDVLGREITAAISSTREVRWESGTLNFTMIFSPNALRGAPAQFLASANTEPGGDLAVERAVITAMPNVTIVRVREALEILKGILGSLSIAVRIVAGVALVAGALVLAGAIAAGHTQRIYESVVLKVLGATRFNVLKAFVFEYCLLGLATGLIAAGVGAAAAFGVVRFLMNIPWEMDGTLVAGVIVSCVVVTLVAGFTGTWRALGIKAAPLLRND